MAFSIYGRCYHDIQQETRRGDLGARMTIVLPTLAVSFAAFCVWLTVRIICEYLQSRQLADK
jgi:hypothetical protein